MSVSILILTLNEEVNLRGCLESVKWSDDIVVLDSFSTDGTRAIAEQYGARFVQRAFDNWSAHSNWALRNIEFKHPWVFYIDADERMGSELQAEVLRLSEQADPDGPVAYRVRYRNIFMGRWIKRSSFYPTWIIRFFRPECIEYEERTVNAHPVVRGKLGSLEGHFDHYSFNKGFEHWFDKHNRYSTFEAGETLREIRTGRLAPGELLSRDPMRRRRALKRLSFRLPLRPYLKFLYMYIARLGFLDGRPGLTYCAMQAVYEYMICLKVRELRRREKDLPI